MVDVGPKESNAKPAELSMYRKLRYFDGSRNHSVNAWRGTRWSAVVFMSPEGYRQGWRWPWQRPAPLRLLERPEQETPADTGTVPNDDDLINQAIDDVFS